MVTEFKLVKKPNPYELEEELNKIFSYHKDTPWTFRSIVFCGDGLLATLSRETDAPFFPSSQASQHDKDWVDPTVL